MTRFDYDEYFGTVLNRFCVQAVIGHPLTVYGEGGQTRGFLNIRDTLQCVELAVANPAGARRVPGLQPVHRAVLGRPSWPSSSARAPSTSGIETEIKTFPNPRIEAERHYYNATNTKLLDLGLEPHHLGEELVQSMLKTIERHRDRVIPRAILPHTTWKAGELEGELPRLSRRASWASASRNAPGHIRPSRASLPSLDMRAADALVQALEAEGVEHVFGIPGGANLPTYDAIYDAKFTHIQARHEQGAGHMAEGYAKASGRVGVAFATSGPGATNLVTPIADAMMDSVPTVFITGQVRTELIGTDGFQEADVTGITMPVVKHSLLVTDPRHIPEYIHNAFHIASTGRPGPVLVDVPQDLSRADIEYEPAEGPPDLPGYSPTTEGNIKQIRIAAKALANAQRPVIYAGGGVVNANASKELLRLLHAPIASR